jgi:hypothetical protein
MPAPGLNLKALYVRCQQDLHGGSFIPAFIVCWARGHIATAKSTSAERQQIIV